MLQETVQFFFQFAATKIRLVIPADFKISEKPRDVMRRAGERQIDQENVEQQNVENRARVQFGWRQCDQPHPVHPVFDERRVQREPGVKTARIDNQKENIVEVIHRHGIGPQTAVHQPDDRYADAAEGAADKGNDGKDHQQAVHYLSSRLRRRCGNRHAADHRGRGEKARDVKKNDEDKSHVPRQKEKPIQRVTLEVFPHVKIILEGIPEAASRVFRSRLHPPLRLFIVRAAVAVLFFMDYGIKIPADVRWQFYPLTDLDRVHRHNKHIGDVCQNYQKRSHGLIFLSSLLPFRFGISGTAAPADVCAEDGRA